MNTEYIVGIDAGGTKIQLRFSTLDGEIIRDVVLPAGDWTNLSASGRAHLLAARLTEAGQRPATAVGVGAHGCDTDSEVAELRLALEDRLGVPVGVVNDAVLIGLASDDTAPTSDNVALANLVVGTGSIAVGRDTAGHSLYAGGWGWLIGDPGSAWGTVREAVRVLSEEQDRGGLTDDPLLPELLTLADSRSLREVVGRMQSIPARDWAAWAPAVFEAAERGSAAALTSIDSGAHALVGLVENLVDRGAVIEGVVAGGNVIVNQPMLAERVARGLAKGPGLPLTVFRGAPVHGAVRLAQRVAHGATSGAADGPR